MGLEHRFTLWAVTIFLLLYFNNCKENSTEPEPESYYSVKGKVFTEGRPATEAKIFLGRRSSFPDSLGNFLFDHILRGNYNLTVKIIGDNSSYSEKSMSISVEGNTEIPAITLLKPIHLYDPEIFGDSAFVIKWSRTDATDFYQYKLYQHENFNLTDSAGIIIRISNDLTDTTFTVSSLIPNDTYYFRVYACNEKEIISGSNFARGIPYEEYENYFPIALGNQWTYDAYASAGDSRNWNFTGTEMIEITNVTSDKYIRVNSTINGIHIRNNWVHSNFDTTYYNNYTTSIDLKLEYGKLSVEDCNNCFSIFSMIVSSLNFNHPFSLDTLKFDFSESFAIQSVYDTIKYSLLWNVGLTSFYKNFSHGNGWQKFDYNLLEHNLN